MKLIDTNNQQEILYYINTQNKDEIQQLFDQADSVRRQHYGDSVYLRGLIEFTNYCKNNCYYCGIRAENKTLTRYRLTIEQILECCRLGDKLGYKTFVLQGGEDTWFSDDYIVEIVKSIKMKFPNNAVTLSLGERSYKSYKMFYNAGADRYLLRHETAVEYHYNKLHPSKMSLKNRKECLYSLKEIGFQVGAGFMVDSPYQTSEMLLEDLLFLKELQPHMVGIGPFLPQSETPFKDFESGSLEKTLKMVALCRLMLPSALIPATTALGTLSPFGREMALKAGANVVMPNLSPLNVRELYSLYDNKICTGDEAAECFNCISNRIRKAGYNPDMSRGDWNSFTQCPI